MYKVKYLDLYIYIYICILISVCNFVIVLKKYWIICFNWGEGGGEVDIIRVICFLFCYMSWLKFFMYYLR